MSEFELVKQIYDILRPHDNGVQIRVIARVRTVLGLDRGGGGGGPTPSVVGSGHGEELAANSSDLPEPPR